MLTRRKEFKTANPYAYIQDRSLHSVRLEEILSIANNLKQ